MILVDTSVLIDYFKGNQNNATDKFQFILNSSVPFGINSLIFQEILQGSKTEKEFYILKTYLESQVFYEPEEGRTFFVKAAEIYFKCRKKGYQIGSAIDCIIAQTAITYDLKLLHHDKDFETISQVVKLSFY